MLDTYGFADCSPVQTPMVPNTHLSASDCPTTADERKYMEQFPYINAVGALMYLATSTRPDIAYTVSKLACFNSNPGKVHWTAVKHLLCYLKGTVDLKLVYGCSRGTEPFVTFADADHAGNPDNGKSTGGYFTRMAGAAIVVRALQGDELQTKETRNSLESDVSN